LKNWLLAHAGLVFFISGCAIIWFVPMDEEGMFPDPFETLFDWAGEVVSMTYLALLCLFIRMGPLALVAGALDRCGLKSGMLALFTLVGVAVMILLRHIGLLVGGTGALIEASLVTVMYAAGRGCCVGVRRLFARSAAGEI